MDIAVLTAEKRIRKEVDERKSETGGKADVGEDGYDRLVAVRINSLYPRVRKRNFPCNDDNVAFMQQVHSKTTGKQSVLLIV